MAEIVDVQEGILESVKDKHTLIDEIGNNIAKIVFCLFIVAAFGYCLVEFVGKDKGVDPNVPVNILASMITGLMGYYFGISKQKKPSESNI